MRKLRSFGFATAPLVKRFDTFEEAAAYVPEMQEKMQELDFEADGIVLKVDDFAAREEIGATTKYPKWIVACKFEKYEATTRVRDIIVQVGKASSLPSRNLSPRRSPGRSFRAQVSTTSTS